jgi:hypothetical protein
MVSQLSIPSLVYTTVMLMQSSAETPFPLGVDVSFDLVVSHPIQLVIMSMQYSTDTSPMFGGDESLDLVFSHSFQPMVEEVVISMQYLIDPTLLSESDKSKEVVVSMKFLVDPTLLGSSSIPSMPFP